MFSEIEKEYRKGLQSRRFFVYYWPRAIWVVLAFLICDFGLGLKHWMMYLGVVIILATFILIFFARTLRKAEQEYTSIRKSPNIFKKLSAYAKIDQAHRIDNLIIDLANHNIRTKEDITLALDYYKSRLPGATKPNFLEWFLTTVVTLASIIIVTYNDEAGSINIREFETALVIAGYILIPFVIAKIVSTIITLRHNKTDTSLVEDLAYIYINFEKYQAALQNRT